MSTASHISVAADTGRAGDVASPADDLGLHLPADPVSRREFLRWLTLGVPVVMLAPGALAGGCARVEGTGRRQFIMIPRSTMIALSDQAYTEISVQEKPCTDPAVVSLVERAGRRVAAQAPLGADTPARIAVFDNPMVNAWAMPNGRIAIYTGILPFCRTEAGLAAIIGHEIAHVVANHGAERMSQQLGVQVLTGLIEIGLESTRMDDEARALTVAAIGAGGALGVLLPFSRRHEYEADRLGVDYMSRAGYDPLHAVELWRRVAQQSQGPQTPEFFSTHPADENRIAALRQRLPRFQQAYQESSTRFGAGSLIPVG